MTVLGTRTFDNLLAGSQPWQTKGVTIKSGANLLRGAVLGKITAGTVPSTGTAAGGNTGTGTMTSVTGGRKVKVGSYVITCVAEKANKGQFEVVAPDGKFVGIAIVGVAFTSDEINFSLSDGTDFVIGDQFTVAVPASANAGKYKLVDKTAVDGSGVANCVLIEDAAAASADVVTEATFTGQLNSAALSFASGTVAADVEADLLVPPANINLKSNNVPA